MEWKKAQKYLGGCDPSRPKPYPGTTSGLDPVLPVKPALGAGSKRGLSQDCSRRRVLAQRIEKWSLTSLQTVDENRRAIGKTCSVIIGCCWQRTM